MVAIPGGTFTMGSPADEPGRDDDETQHPVDVASFEIGQTEVTQGQWAQLMDNNPSYFDRGRGGSDEHPVERVSWFDALAYLNRLSAIEDLTACYVLEDCRGQPGQDYVCERVEFKGTDCPGYRLPTEVEWEYAARAGTPTAVYAGPIKIKGQNNAPILDRIAWYGGNSGVDEDNAYDCSGWEEKQYPSMRCATHPVGRKAPNQFGLNDMIGNVWEWTNDEFADYPAKGDPGQVGRSLEPGRAVIRGCAWSSSAADCRAANRGHDAPDDRLQLRRRLSSCEVAPSALERSTLKARHAPRGTRHVLDG